MNEHIVTLRMSEFEDVDKKMQTLDAICAGKRVFFPEGLMGDNKDCVAVIFDRYSEDWYIKEFLADQLFCDDEDIASTLLNCDIRCYKFIRWSVNEMPEDYCKKLREEAIQKFKTMFESEPKDNLITMLLSNISNADLYKMCKEKLENTNVVG